MNCYYHNDVPAVATCKVCGKSLCKECADRYSPVLCDECYEVLRREEFEELKQSRKKLIISFLWSGVLLFLGLIGFFGDIPLWSMLLVSIYPFGWRYFSAMKMPEYLLISKNGALGMVVFICLKLSVALIACIPLFIYAIYSFIKISKAVKTAEIEGLE